MKFTAYRTRSYNEDLYWSNEDGWVDLQSATLFTISQSNSMQPPLETVAIDNIRMEGTKRVVESTRKEFPPSQTQRRAMLDKFYSLGIKSYEEQRALCVEILGSVSIECQDHENLGELIEAIASNINDGTLGYDCLELFATA